MTKINICVCNRKHFLNFKFLNFRKLILKIAKFHFIEINYYFALIKLRNSIQDQGNKCNDKKSMEYEDYSEL